VTCFPLALGSSALGRSRSSRLRVTWQENFTGRSLSSIGVTLWREEECFVSTIAYAQLTNARESAAPGTSTTTQAPGLRTYVDALAALVPAEVLTLHALIISNTTKTEQQPVTAGATDMKTVTTILPAAADTLSLAFWGLVILSIALYAAPRHLGGKWDRYDWIRIIIAPLAFFGWTMLQPSTAFDAAFPTMDPFARTVGALFIGAVLGALTAGLAMKVDAKT
jgi:hypothetical protein